MKSALLAPATKVAILLLTSTLITSNSYAAEPTEHAEGPCMKIMEACKAAGYNKSVLNEKKSLSKDCIQPLLNGQKVDGINVNPKDIEACKVKKAEIKTEVKSNK